MIECSAPQDFLSFINLLGDIVEMVSEKLYIIHSETKDIVWLYDEQKEAYCRIDSIVK
jgi:hypothetical protein